MEDASRIRIGISSCLLGEMVRFDGGHKEDRYLTQTLGRYFEWVAVCPEMEIGLGAPRESLRLVGDPEDPRILAPRSGVDHTESMRAYADRRLDELAPLGLCGYLLKKGSPSWGMERVRVYHEGGGSAVRQGKGVFAQALLRRFPLLPVEEEGRLHDMALRENFIERVFAFRRWTLLLESRPRARDLVAFHADNKFSLLAHCPTTYGELGRLVANAGRRPFARLLEAYGGGFLGALRKRATSRKNANVLQHLQGFLKTSLDADAKEELSGVIREYREGLVPLVVPLTLLRHHFRRSPHPWVERQTYLNPYPAELMLRNHV
ncbi:MAG: YbgA family protein [Planctomycetaceae bacterium]